MSEIINIPGEKPLEVKAVDLQPSDTGFNWVRAMSPARQQELIDLGAALLEAVGQAKAKTEKTFENALQKAGLSQIAQVKLRSLTKSQVTLYDIFWCYRFAVVSKQLAENPAIAFEDIDDLAAESIGVSRNEVSARKARLDFCELIAKFQEAQIEHSRGNLMLRKWHDAMKGDNTSAKFFLAPANNTEEIVISHDFTKFSEAELQEQILRVKKRIGANRIAPPKEDVGED